MAIELSILSGNKQGKTISIQADRFVAGDHPRDELSFDSTVDQGSRGQRLQFTRTTDGWTVENLGKLPVFIDQRELSNSGSISSGSIVRLSDTGPDFLFKVSSGQETQAVESPLDSKPYRAKASPAEASLQPGEINEEEQALESPDAPHRPLSVARTGVVLALALLLVFVIWVRSDSDVTGLDLPIFPVAASQEHTVDEGQRLAVSCSVVDVNAGTGSTLSYSLGEEVPDHVEIDGKTGLVRWTPSEEQGPGDHRITVQAVRQVGGLSAESETSFNVRVEEVNQAPKFPPAVSNLHHVEAGKSLEVLLTAHDADLPAQQLHYELLPGAPDNVEFDSSSGKLSWTPESKYAGAAQRIRLSVRDDANPPLKAEATIQVFVDKPDPWRHVITQVDSSIYVLMVEEPKSKRQFPFGTAVAIASNRLLTNASLGIELNKRLKQGWRVLALSETATDGIPLNSILIHKAFLALQDKPAEQIYFDMALLEVERKVGGKAPQLHPVAAIHAQPKDSLLCIGYSHRAEAASRLDHPELAFFRVEVLGTSALEVEGADNSSAPRLLHVNLFPHALVAGVNSTPLPRNLYGSPIFNDQGQIVALYTEQAAPADENDDPSDSPHYAVIPIFAQAWLEGLGKEVWVSPEDSVRP